MIRGFDHPALTEKVHMKTGNTAFRAQQSSDWTQERVSKLQKQEIQQLRANATALGADDVVALCDVALRALPKAGRKTSVKAAANG